MQPKKTVIQIIPSVPSHVIGTWYLGAVGDWINYFTSKQKRVFDELFSEKMKHSELARHFEDSSI